MADLTPDEWVDLLVRRSAELRGAGVLHLELGDMKVRLAETVPEFDDDADVDDDGLPKDPLRDPETFGGKLPTLRRSEQ